MSLGAVRCAVCFESLFDARNDLDERLPAAAPNCGHVFHLHCLKSWFKSQADQYLANLRDSGVVHARGESPSISDCPAECPTCRTECFADPETGEPEVHRLFVNFKEIDASSQIGSSPVREKTGRSDGDHEILGFARRARDMEVEASKWTVDEDEIEVLGVLRRGEALVGEIGSSKASEALRKYTTGLTTSIDKFRRELRDNPMAATSRAELQKQKQLNTALKNQMAHEKDILHPQQIAEATRAERKKMQKEVDQAKKDAQTMRREYDKEVVARKNAKRAAEEAEAESNKKTAELKKEIKRLEKETEKAAEVLRERTMQLKAFQAKAETRHKLKDRISELEAENSRLGAESSTMAISRRTRSSRSASLQRGEASTSKDITKGARGSRFLDPDESLQIDPPVLEADTSFEILPQISTGPGGSRSTTARTYSFDLDKNSGAGGSKRNGAATCKYFSAGSDDSTDAVVEGISGRGDHRSILIRDSSSPKPASPKRSRTNPFVTTRQQSDAKKRLRDDAGDVEIIVLRDDSPPVDEGNKKRGKDGSPPRKRQTRSASRKPLAEILGIADSRGVPQKGVASGVKAKRRA